MRAKSILYFALMLLTWKRVCAYSSDSDKPQQSSKEIKIIFAVEMINPGANTYLEQEEFRISASNKRLSRLGRV